MVHFFSEVRLATTCFCHLCSIVICRLVDMTVVLLLFPKMMPSHSSIFFLFVGNALHSDKISFLFMCPLGEVNISVSSEEELIDESSLVTFFFLSPGSKFRISLLDNYASSSDLCL